MIRTYKYKLYPNPSQIIFIQRHIDACRFVYNWGLALRIDTYQNDGKSLSFYDTGKELTRLKQIDGYEWLQNINAQSIEISLKNLDKAYTAFFKTKKGFPKFKSRKKTKQAMYIRRGIKVDIENSRIFIPKNHKGIYAVIDRIPIGVIKNGTIVKTASGKYFIALQTDDKEPLPIPALLDENKAIGIDLGLTHFAILSNGTKIANPRYLGKALKQLNKLQRQLLKKKKGSSNYNKARIKVARLHEYIANQRLDFLHKATKQLIDENQVDTYCLEDLNIKGMMKNHKLAKSISDVSWAKFIELLIYKCKWYGKNLLFIGRFEPSSKMCSCGKINHELTLKERIWTCKHCGLTHDRDILAANNIKHFTFNKQNLLRTDYTDIDDFLNTNIGMDHPELTPAKSKRSLLVETGNQ